MPTLGYFFTTDNIELPVKDGASTVAITRGLILAGVDNTGKVRFLKVDTDGKLVAAP